MAALRKDLCALKFRKCIQFLGKQIKKIFFFWFVFNQEGEKWLHYFNSSVV